MLDATPIHLAFNRPFIQKSELIYDKKTDVSADTRETQNFVSDDMKLSFKMDLSHLLLLNLFLNTISMLFLISMVRR